MLWLVDGLGDRVWGGFYFLFLGLRFALCERKNFDREYRYPRVPVKCIYIYYIYTPTRCVHMVEK